MKVQCSLEMDRNKSLQFWMRSFIIDRHDRNRFPRSYSTNTVLRGRCHDTPCTKNGFNDGYDTWNQYHSMIAVVECDSIQHKENTCPLLSTAYTAHSVTMNCNTHIRCAVVAATLAQLWKLRCHHGFGLVHSYPGGNCLPPITCRNTWHWFKKIFLLN